MNPTIFGNVLRISKHGILERNSSIWSKVKQAPPDPIFGVTDAFNKDKNPNKVNLGVGAYRDDKGKPYVLKSVRKAEMIVVKKKLNKEYLPITGNAKMVKAAIKLAFGNADRIKEGHNASSQSLSGTGALFVLGRFIAQYTSGPKVLYMPNPTWGNHKNIFTRAGLKLKSYTYYKPSTRSLNFKGCIADIKKIPERSGILLHACAHNPTGVDPKKEQWKEMSKVIKERKLFAFFDMAYQGFATGNTENDAYAPRLFLKEGHSMCLAQSFAKNLGLYGERVGTCSIICKNKEESKKVLSQLKALIRGIYSNPPLHGGRIVETVLTTPDLRKLWLSEVKMMADRVITMRKKLKSLIMKAGSKKKWDHITNQIGMFCFTGMTPDQVKNIAKKHSVYLTKDGRISVVGLSSKNVNHVANAIHSVTK